MAGVRFGPGFGRQLSQLLRGGVGVHHAGMLPKYRRVVETLAQAGLLPVICGTDTLGVGINVPIRTVLFTGLAKYDGSRQRVLRTREFQQIAGRAGRAGFDTAGHVVVQAPEHVIENEQAKAKAAQRVAEGRKKSKAQLKKAPEGAVVWTEQTFDKLVKGDPEPLKSRMKVDNAMIINVASREEDTFAVMRRLTMDNNEDRRSQLKLARRAIRLTRSLLASGVLRRLDEPDELGRRYVLDVALPDDFALNQPLSHFALAALDVLDTEAATFALDVVSVVESVLEAPRQVLFAQQREARGEEIGRLKAEGVEYDERMAIVEEITWPKPLADLLEALFETYRGTHPWLPLDALDPKSVVRQMWEEAMGFTAFVSRFGLARSEGLVLRYLSDAYKALRQTVPEALRTDELDEIIEWLGETVRQTDSSLIDEWEALSDPEHASHAVTHHEAPPPPRPLSAQPRVFGVMVRNAMWARVDAVARDDLDGLVRLDGPDAPWTRRDWDEAIEAYYAEHDRVLLDADARGPSFLQIGPEDPAARTRTVRQTLHDPEGHHDWVIDAVVDCAASDEEGSAVVVTDRFHRL